MLCSHNLYGTFLWLVFELVTGLQSCLGNNRVLTEYENAFGPIIPCSNHQVQPTLHIYCVLNHSKRLYCFNCGFGALF